MTLLPAQVKAEEAFDTLLGLHARPQALRALEEEEVEKVWEEEEDEAMEENEVEEGEWEEEEEVGGEAVGTHVHMGHPK
jgi:hypothetical protein